MSSPTSVVRFGLLDIELLSLGLNMTFDQKMAFFRKLFTFMKAEDIDMWVPFAAGALTAAEWAALNPTSSCPVETPAASSRSAPESARDA
jgi:hypothetical protein